MGEPLLRMQGISKHFGPVQALSNVDLTLETGEVLALMGENGAGKSTLMNILSGALQTYSGKIYVEGKEVSFPNPLASQEAGIAMIHQELQLVKEMTVAENVFLGRELGGLLVNKKQMATQAQRYLDMLELDIRPTQKIKDLRVGEQQMVEIAKALSLNARILVMDEPTSAISEQEAEKLFTVIRRLAREGVAIIYITHRMEEVFAISDRLTVLRDGQLIDSVRTGDVTKDQVISMMVGREITNMYPKVDAPIGEEVLRVEHLGLRSPEDSFRRELTDISFTLRKGEVLGIGGLLGSGRTEIFESLFGVHPGDQTGDIFIEGQKVHIKNPDDAIAAGLSFATEDRKGKGLVLPRSIGENMSLPMLKRFSKFGFMQTDEEHAKWEEQMQGMRIKAPSYNTLCETLSGGNQQKVVLGRWLITNPKVLLLDEPTRGIDVGAKAEIYVLIGELARKGMGILVISSEMPELLGICDRIITICEGRITGEFTRAEATQEKLLYAATLREEEAI